MPIHSPYPLAYPALRILDLAPTFAVTPSTDHQLTAFNPSTPDSWSSLRACTERSEVTCLPPLSFLLLADRLGELYETIFPDHPEWLNQETAVWESEQEVAVAVDVYCEAPVFDRSRPAPGGCWWGCLPFCRLTGVTPGEPPDLPGPPGIEPGTSGLRVPPTPCY